MTDKILTHHLQGYRLDPNGLLLRDHVRPVNRQTEHYQEKYDRTTLFYDCVYLPRERGHLITAPRFLNLWEPFRKGLRQNNRKIRRVMRFTWLRCEQIFIPGPMGGLSMKLGKEQIEIPSRSSFADAFAGLNAMVAVSKNNHLDWIQEWAQFHVTDHRAQGVVLFDNGSTDYNVEDIGAALASVCGLERALIVSAPFPYGPADKSARLDVSPRFFQTAMLNLARRDALDQARAVLSIDIDELIIGPEGASVYDAAVANRVGMVSIAGNWVYPSPETQSSAPQSLHVFRAEPDQRTNGKWCMAPRGLMSRLFGWAVHKIGGLVQILFTRQDTFSLIHCRAASTGWKGGRYTYPANLRRDPDLEARMTRHFGGKT